MSNIANDDSYMFMVSGLEAFPIWVMDQSHNFAKHPEAVKLHLNTQVSMQKVILVPYSFLVADGLLTHCSAVYNDMPNAGYMTRVHGNLILVGSSVDGGLQFNLIGSKYAWNIKFDESSTLPITAVKTNHDAQTPLAANGDVSNDDVPNNVIPPGGGEDERTI